MNYQIKNRHFHHALVEVGCAILDDLDSYHLLSLKILTLDNLAEGTLSQNVQDEVSIPENSQLRVFLNTSQ